MKVLISGASGLIGKALKDLLLKNNHEVWTLVRAKADSPQNNQIFWDIENQSLNLSEVEGFDAFINLSGENIAGGRWTESFKKKLHDSRIKTTGLLVDSINKLKSPPKVFLSASAIGFYGDRGEESLDESSQQGLGFLPTLSKLWEDSANQAKNTRIVNLRTSVVLSEEGGALSKMKLPFKLGLGGRLGDGKQYMSWISLEDEIGAIYFCLTNPDISGPVNLTSPQPVRNAEFTKTLASVLRRPAIFHVPRLAAKIFLGEMADELLFGSNKIFPIKLLEKGFKFQHTELRSALEAIFI